MLLLDGKRIGCAFVQYSSVFDASRAIKKMNGEKIQGMYNVYIIITYGYYLRMYIKFWQKGLTQAQTGILFNKPCISLKY